MNNHMMNPRLWSPKIWAMKADIMQQRIELAHEEIELARIENEELHVDAPNKPIPSRVLMQRRKVSSMNAKILRAGLRVKFMQMEAVLAPYACTRSKLDVSTGKRKFQVKRAKGTRQSLRLRQQKSYDAWK